MSILIMFLKPTLLGRNILKVQAIPDVALSVVIKSRGDREGEQRLFVWYERESRLNRVAGGVSVAFTLNSNKDACGNLTHYRWIYTSLSFVAAVAQCPVSTLQRR